MKGPSLALPQAENGELVLSAQPGTPQEQFLASAADIGVFGGGSGGGKTVSLLIEPLRHVHDPAFGAVFFRRSFPEIDMEGGPWDLSRMIYPHLGGVAKEGLHEWVFPSGARIKFSHLERDETSYAWKGAQVCLILFDQLEMFSQFQFWYLMSRNVSMCGARSYIRASVNPDPDSFVADLISWWIGPDGYPLIERSGKLRWFCRDEASDDLIWADSPEELPRPQDAKSLTFVPALLADNPAGLRGDPSRLATLQSLPLVERLRLGAGNWTVRPTAGMVFDRSWFPLIDAVPRDDIVATVRSWDKAGSEGRGKWTVGVRMIRYRSNIYIIDDVVRGQWGALERERIIKSTAEDDGFEVEVVEEQEPGSGGKESAESTIRNLSGYAVHAKRPTGSKLVRAQPYSAQAEARNVKLLRAPWNKSFTDEHHNFDEKAGHFAYTRDLRKPGGFVCDQVDASSQAFNWLAAKDADEEAAPPAPIFVIRESQWPT